MGTCGLLARTWLEKILIPRPEKGSEKGSFTIHKMYDRMEEVNM